MNKISIIVPVYGVEAYLACCVDSLLAQTYRDFELILVDDASPDRCGAICDSYAEKDSRVRVIHKENGGAASARNVGLNAATGQYICFVDSDDAVSEDYLQRLLETLICAKADIAVCAFSNLTQVSNDPYPIEPAGTYTREQYIARFLQNWTCALIWNKIYRREVIGDLRFAEGHRIDDEFFTYRVILNSRRVQVMDAPLYSYRQRRSSVMKADSSYRERMYLDKVAYLTERIRIVSEEIPGAGDAFFGDLLDNFVRIWRQSRDMPQVADAIRRWMKNNLWQVLRAGVNFKLKLSYLQSLLLTAPGAELQPDIPLADPNTYYP